MNVLDAHQCLGDVVLGSTCVADGGPRAVRVRGRPLPERYLPGRFLRSVREDTRRALIFAANNPPADWWVKQVLQWTGP